MKVKIGKEIKLVFPFEAPKLRIVAGFHLIINAHWGVAITLVVTNLLMILPTPK